MTPSALSECSVELEVQVSVAGNMVNTFVLAAAYTRETSAVR